MDPITVTDAYGTDIAHILDYSLDLAYGTDEQDFTLSFGTEPRLTAGCRVYIDGTEYGGIVDGVSSDTIDNEPSYFGRSWTGVLAGKVIVPQAGYDYYTVSGDANACIGTVLSYIGVDSLFQADSASSGITISNYSFERFVDAYTGLRAMLKASGAKLRMVNDQGVVKVSAAAIATYADTVDDNLMDFEVSRNWRTVNHLVCMGEGELKNRTVIHLYADGDGVVSQTQTFFGLDEITATYDYNNADAAELLAEGTKKLEEMQSGGETRATINTETIEVGDIITAVDNSLNITVVAEVTKKVVQTNNGVLDVTYETGAESAPTSSVHTGGDSTPIISVLAAYPVGSIYMSVNSTDPGTLFGGTWARITGKFLLSATDGGSSGANQAAGNTGGEATHTLTVNEMPSHTHVQDQHRHALGRRNVYDGSGSALGVVGYGAGTANDSYTGYTTPTNQNTGGGQAHNNMPPYLAVYVWQRTA